MDSIIDFQLLSVVIPIYNEADSIVALVDRCLVACQQIDVDFELILVDDGSTDGSHALLRQACTQHPTIITTLFLNRNYGQHTAVLAGFAEAHGDIIVTLDADLQNPPEEIPRLVATARQGFDVVASYRIDRQDSLFRRLGSRLMNRMAQRATSILMQDYGCMLRAYHRPIIDAILQCRERSTFIPVLANSFASRPTEIAVQHAPRQGGQSKYGLLQLIQLQFDLLTSMTALPLRLFSLVGGMIALVGISLGMVLLVGRLYFGSTWAVDSFFALFALLFGLIGVQLLGIGLLGEYLGRIYDDVRARPRFLIRERIARR